MTEDDQKQRLARLEARLAEARKAQAPKPRVDEHYSQANLAWRMVIELVAGLGIGFSIGYGLDSLFGTIPILLVTFTLLGLAAGVKTMLRSAKEIQEKIEAEEVSRQTNGADKAAREDERD
ncbi:AtpZ/AtpI family protein [Pseudodonghicola sp.]|uniref:AtpZ/AtpI family protein n=1 Tax=Pseudodonghicola sp. TaxID=1969463 RepID=UPI003A97B7E4